MGRGRYRSGIGKAGGGRRTSLPTGHLTAPMLSSYLLRGYKMRGKNAVRRILAVPGYAPRPRHQRKATNCQVKNGLNAPGCSGFQPPFESAGW